MMVNKNKIRGTKWENDAVKKLNTFAGLWKRVPGSGSLGTILKEPELIGDIKGNTRDFFGKNFVLEAKTGYGGAKQLTVQKEWFDKVFEEAGMTFSFPGIICKFADARVGVRQFVAFDIDVFGEILVYVKTLSNEVDKIYGELAEYERKLE